MNTCTIITGLFMLACVAALAVIPLNAAGAFGMTPDPLSGMFAVLLSSPWSQLFDGLMSETSTAWNMVVAGVGMALNAGLLWGACRLVSRLF